MAPIPAVVLITALSVFSVAHVRVLIVQQRGSLIKRRGVGAHIVIRSFLTTGAVPVCGTDILATALFAALRVLSRCLMNIFHLMLYNQCAMENEAVTPRFPQAEPLALANTQNSEYRPRRRSQDQFVEAVAANAREGNRFAWRTVGASGGAH